MTSHNGVSCDSCMKTNFPGRRYKCLLCDNYDLCGSCYDIEAESQNHKNDHPMQCILTETASELFYAGESISRRTVVSLTCPHCGLSGFIPRTLLTHCIEKHSSTSIQNKNSQVVMCPICVTSSSHGNRPRFVLLADHIATVHDDGTGGGGGGGDEDLLVSSSTTQARHGENEEEDSDEDEDDEEPNLYDLEHRAFIEEEHRRQEAARQRLAHASSLAAVVRNDYAAALSGNSNSQRRPLSRQTAIRGSRGSLRGHFNNFPYGAVPRTTTGFASGTSLRNPTGTSAGSLNSNTASNDPYAAFVFSQDPMLEFVSRLVNNQQSSTTPPINSSNSQFYFAPSIPIHAPSSATASSDFARIQQQIENNESIVQIKSTLLNAKQKRSSHAQQQQQSSSQPVIITHPSGYDYQLWQQHFPALQPAFNNPNFLTGIVPNDSVVGNSNISHSFSKNSQQSYREYDPRSLLGKTLRNDHDVNKDETNEIRTQQQQQDHVSFLQSILLSTMITSVTDEQNEKQLTINKENHF
ncbi:unnamed protein product [Adineta steineri]|uniref:RING-type E3 ubiquitin transferase n=2 Tax=Adineta steineri TaxID=433720 RepID=A0A815IKD4_9BILA|nr:unnamed protein product [Adineta steineri]CAF1367045.1 unnamed protein product [Adineta steineri]CAF1380600.1 unnamed protein product [Adineta steineri]